MSLDALDAKIAAWKTDVQNMVNNLLELTELTSYQMLSGGGAEALEGPDAARIRDAVQKVDGLVSDMDQLRELIERAEAMRRDLPLFGRSRAIGEIAGLFDTASVRIQAERVPLERRGLFGAAESDPRVTPTELKWAMEHSFSVAKPILLSVDKAWRETAPELAALGGEAQRMQTAFTQRGLPVPAAIIAFSDKITEASRNLHARPLESKGATDYVDSFAKAARKSMSTLAEAERSWQEILAKKKSQLTTFARLSVECAEASRALPGEPLYAPQVEVLKALETHLAEAERAGAAGRRADADTALNAFRAIYRPVIGPLRALHQRLQNAAAPRTELMERWQLAKMKREMGPRELTQDRALSNFAARIEQLVERGAALDEIDRMVYAFEVRLAELLSRRAP